MKIVQLTPYAMDRPGGVQSHIRDLSRWLRSQGHDVRIVAPPGTGQLANIGNVVELGRVRQIAVHGTKFELTRASRADLQTCVAELRSWGAEVAHLHTPWTPMLPFQVWRALGIPGVATFHATLPETSGFDPLAWTLKRSAHWFNRRLKGIVVPSKAPQNQWRDNNVHPVPEVLAPTVDLSAWRDARKASIPSGDFNVVCMGRLEERKGTATLLRAWRDVETNRPSARLIIAGDGPRKDDLLHLARVLNLTTVDFVDPPSDEIARRMIADADVFAAPARHGESFGLVLIEAMAAGTLPVAAANPGYATVMTGPGADLLVPPGDPDALAQKLLELAAQPALQNRLLRWAKGHADHFDVRHLGPSYLSFFRAALT
ncbi:phosphatidylinositol alpha-mannosyltransferase [Shimia isoporae]|uniref:Phosphatidylinositol alpha-mannosyltransferase n=1 Tax=Shimia isoporae TaxID=647720 RepID=A0A4R1N622_9RHOB|nr:glycosyltransferase family 4 protein [Shimia isoporae]TCL01532.1 phosphatidylinositol alpha-mannosyltransferase [Shimia isoporae]